MGTEGIDPAEVERVERLLVRGGVYVGGFEKQRRKLATDIATSRDGHHVTDEAIAALKWKAKQLGTTNPGRWMAAILSAPMEREEYLPALIAEMNEPPPSTGGSAKERERSNPHIQNMPLGSRACDCDACVAYRKKNGGSP